MCTVVRIPPSDTVICPQSHWACSPGAVSKRRWVSEVTAAVRRSGATARRTVA